MALESVFGTPPPVVGAVVHKDHTMKHGEKQSDDSMVEADPEKEEGEIEDGEIIDSGEEQEPEQKQDEGIAANNGPTVVHFTRMTAGLHPDLENEIEAMGKRKKKKKKRRKRQLSAPDGEHSAGLSGSEDVAPPKSKKHKSRYVDHDRVSDGNGPWFGGSLGFNKRHQESSGEPYDSPRRGSSPPHQPEAQPPPPKRSPSKSPPGLYDSPPESSGDEFKGPSGSASERGGGMYNNYSNSNYDGLGSDYMSRKKSNKTGKGGKRRKGDKRSKGGRGSKPNKRKESRRQICKFYLDGKCHKGDECGYSHDQPQARKMELCKFYLNGFCHKGDSCIYMHKDFPCKFFHTGAKCYSADNCKFSHDELTEEMRWVLEKYLDKEDDGGNSDCSAPKHHRPSLLGSPPRHIKEMAAQEALRKIPSLFDIEVEPPPTITPPSCPSQPSRPNFYSDTMSPPCPSRPPLLPFPTSTFDPDPADFPFDEDIRPPFGPMGGPGGPMNEPCFGGGPNGPNMPPPPYCGEPRSMMEPSMQDIDERFPPMMEDQRRFQSGQDDDRSDMMGSRQRGPKHSNDTQSFNSTSWRNLVSDVDMRTRPHLEMEEEVENLVSNDWDEETTTDRDKSHQSESESDNKRSEFTGSISSSNNINAGSGGGIPIPLHLPKKQRELFLRIQQQQRQADSSQEDSDKGEWKKTEAEDVNADPIVTNKWEEEAEDEEEKAVKKAEKESWYSSDEDSDDEDRPLTAVLKKLQQEPLQKQTFTPSLFNITQMLQSITGVKPPTAAISGMESPVSKMEFGRDPRSQKLADTRDPRSSRNAELRDPRARTLRDPRSLANSTPPEVPLPLRDPRLLFSSSDSNSVDDLKFPTMKEQKSSMMTPLKSESWSDTEGDGPLKTAFHPIPYRLRAVAVSQSVYSNVAQSIQMDPKLFSSDPRLRRQLMNDPRLRRSAALLTTAVSVKKEPKDSPMESKDSTSGIEEPKGPAKKDILLPRFAQQRLSDDKEPPLDVKKDILLPQFGRRISEDKEQDSDVKPDTRKEMLLPSFGHHRLGAVTVPCTPRDAPKVVSANNGKVSTAPAVPEVKLSPERSPDEHKAPFEEELGSSDDDDSSDDLVIIESTIKEEPDEPVILEAKIVKSPKASTSKVEGVSDEPVIILESGTPPKSLKIDLSFKRRRSMEYASPLGYTEADSTVTTSSYNRKASPKNWSNSARSPGSADGKPTKTQAVSSIPPSPSPPPPPLSNENNSRSPPSSTNLKSLVPDSTDDGVDAMDNTSLKDIFKTIDPTASPFC